MHFLVQKWRWEGRVTLLLSFQHHKISYLLSTKMAWTPWCFSVLFFHPGFCQMLEAGEITPKGEKSEITNLTHSVTLRLLLLTRSLRSECVCLVLPSSKRERVGGVFLDILRRERACIISWNLRFTCETEGLKVERLPDEVAIKNYQWMLTHFSLFLCFARTW